MPKSNTGGKRQGAGNPGKQPAQAQAGYAEQAGSELARLNNNIDLSQYLLSEKERLVAIYISRGRRQTDIAKELGCAVPTISVMKRKPDFQRLVADLQMRMALDPTEVFHPMLNKATRVYEDILERDDKTAMEAARDVFDRTFGKPIVRQMSATVSKIEKTIIIKEDPDFDNKYIIEGD